MKKSEIVGDEPLAVLAIRNEIDRRKGAKRKMPDPLCEKNIMLTDNNYNFLEIVANATGASPCIAVNVLLDLIRQEALARKWQH